MSLPYRNGTSARCAGGTGTTGHNSPLTPAVPSGLQVGDFMLLTYITDSNSTDAGGQGTINTPSGWTAIGTQKSTSSSIAWAWWKLAESADLSAGPTVDYGTTTVGSGGKACATLDAWSGSDTTTPVAVSAIATPSSTSSASHVMPTVDTTGKGQCLIISAALDREPTESASFSASSGWSIRNSSLGTAGATGGNPGACIVDSGSLQDEDTALGGATITSSQNASALYGYTIALAPLVSTQTARPSVDVTVTGWTPSTTLGSGVQDSSLIADSDDGTYLASAAGPSSQVLETKLQVMSAAPNTITSRVQFAGGAVSGTIITALYEGTTEIASRTDTWASDPPTDPADLVLTLTTEEQAAISDLTDLRIRSTVTAA